MTVLIIVFNHAYEKNLPRLRNLYKNRFSHIFFLMPFYKGQDPDVISVSSPAHYFQGYFTQAYDSLKDYNFDHWLVIGDDLIMNPLINETNVAEQLKLEKEGSYIPKINRFDDCTKWGHAWKYLKFTLNSEFFEGGKHLPSSNDAMSKLKELNLEPHGMRFENVYADKPFRKKRNYRQKLAKYGPRYLKDLVQYEKTPDALLYGDYPCCWGYSDIFMVSRDNLQEFSHVCGVMAAANLFVEIAIPTALALTTAGKISHQENCELQGEALWRNRVSEVLGEYENSLSRLLSEFPHDKLFLHPVKLSQWK